MNQDSLAIQKLMEQKVQLLQKLDSMQLNQKLNELAFKVDNQNQIISEVNSFYDSAWLKLIFIITLLGIIIPFITQYFQRKNFKDLTSFIDSQLKDSFDTKLNELKEYNETKINSAIIEYERKIKDLEHVTRQTVIGLDANTYYLQGRALYIEKNWMGSIASHVKAAILFCQSDKPDRILPQIVNINRSVKNLKNKEDLNRLDKYLLNQTKESAVKMPLSEFIEQMEQDPNSEQFQKVLNEIKNQIEKIKSSSQVLDKKES